MKQSSFLAVGITVSTIRRTRYPSTIIGLMDTISIGLGIISRKREKGQKRPSMIAGDTLRSNAKNLGRVSSSCFQGGRVAERIKKGTFMCRLYAQLRSQLVNCCVLRVEVKLGLQAIDHR